MSVVNWDHVESSEAPLSEKQSEAIFLLSTLDSRSPLAPTATQPDDTSVAGKNSEPSDSKIVRIQLASHFYSWLSSIEQHLNATEDEDDVKFLQYLSQRRKFCSDLVDDLGRILGDLSTLKENYLSVSSKTNSLHDACEHLLQQQGELSDDIAQLEQVLTYFVNIDVVEAELRSIHKLVSRDTIKPILDRLDKSMSFLRLHPQFRESEAYLSRSADALTRALKLITDNVTRIIERTINELLELNDVVSPDNSFILLYGRFRSQGPKIRSMISLVEDRIENSSEYVQALLECQKFYLQHREELLAPIVRTGISDLVEKYPNDHCALLRTAGAFMVHTCEDETRLFCQFFNPELSTSLNQMLSTLCRCLYDAFRPLIIHINHVEILSELCDILKYELTDEHVTSSQLDMSAFAELCSMLLADVQERLIFRSHIYIKSQILGYEPSPGDLSYPEKLIMMNNIAKATATAPTPDSEGHTPDSGDGSFSETDTSAQPVSELDLAVQPGPNMSLSPADLHGMWYPTVRRALVFLSKLSRCLDPNSFRGLAQECVSMCVLSLLKASEAISSRRSTIDGQLFLIKHLLILREQMSPFHVEFSVKETSLDFSSYKAAAMGIWNQRGGNLFALNRHNLLLKFLLETPNVVEVEVDSRRQLDGQLKQMCEKFIDETVTRLCGELPSFLDRANAVLAAPGARLSDQTFASASEVKELVSSAHRALLSAFGRSGRSKQQASEGSGSTGFHLLHYLNIYLANPDTEGILLRRIQAGVLQHWRSVHQLLSEQYTDEDRMIIACPTESQIRLLFQDA
ncbi:Golgi transport complex subunit 3 [Clonorchis sinensis]|uniref:Conserved oligomeric Golgi complex subunit 3 n=1 Tax=Clonorchis sinensis TaxID=79923 RepID=A0A8T1M6K7_CLOSI|nr:Golgi transport complex subunit 3 [Clonorchis sinensis]